MRRRRNETSRNFFLKDSRKPHWFRCKKWGSIYIEIIEYNLIVVQRVDVCGRPNLDGGLPWQAKIISNDVKDIECSGTLISDRWLLTAAQCING